jgi:hypothetical protein
MICSEPPLSADGRHAASCSRSPDWRRSLRSPDLNVVGTEKIKVAGGPADPSTRRQPNGPIGAIGAVFLNHSALTPILRRKTPALTGTAGAASGVPHIICFG